MCYRVTHCNTEGETVGRSHLSVRIDAKLKEEFLKAVQEKGLSTCYVLEGLIRGWLEGAKAKNNPVLQSHTIHVHQQHVVKRPRRYHSEGEEGRSGGGEKRARETQFHDRFGRRKNEYDPVRGWTFNPELAKGLIVVHQPKVWGKNRCAEGFTWSPNGYWFKFEE